ncbi:MAG: Na+/H+ antiporter NhaA [Actinomycetota bacterium]
MNRPQGATVGGDVKRLSPLRDFLHTESAGAILLAASALAALVWANSPWSDSYDSLWESRLVLSFAGHSLDLDLRHWVNDGLMAIFFFVVGLEIKRELTNGHLADKRSAMLPAIAALGGMIVPAAVYLAIAGADTPRGWAIPMATDIALAVGVLSAAGSRVPSSLRAFLLGLAIVDDIGAIIIIAAVYSTGISVGWLAASVVGVVLAVLFKTSGLRSTWAYVAIGAVVWLGLLNGGVHPTIAGVVMGLLAPASPHRSREYVDSEDLARAGDVEYAMAATTRARETVSTVEWLQHVLHPWTSFVIVPVFALANSGIHLSIDGMRDAVSSPITWGVFFGLLAGKPIGVLLATRIAVRSGVADQPVGAESRQLLGIGSAAGIGFTVAIFITKLALPSESDQSNAKLAILAASILAAVMSSVLLRTGGRRDRVA